MDQMESAELVELKERIGKWREHSGGSGSRVPEEIWQAAVKVSRGMGLGVTSRTLGLSYVRLREKKRLAEDEKSKQKKKAKVLQGSLFVAKKPEGFVELGVGQLGGGKTVIEFIGRRGDRVRVDVTGSVDVMGLAHMFWRSEP